MDDSKLVVIRSFSSVGEASIYKSLLESSGVPCELLNELTAEVLPIRNEMMPVRLVVNEADARRAEEILGAKNSIRRAPNGGKSRSRNGTKRFRAARR